MQVKSGNNKMIVADIATGIGMILFFLVARTAGWNYIWPLHFVNIFLLVPAITYAVWHATQKNSAPYPYLKGLAKGFVSAVRASAILCVFLVLYLNFMDPGYLDEIRNDVPLGNYITPLVMSLVFFTEQVCGALVLTLIVLLFFRRA